MAWNSVLVLHLYTLTRMEVYKILSQRWQFEYPPTFDWRDLQPNGNRNRCPELWMEGRANGGERSDRDMAIRIDRFNIITWIWMAEGNYCISLYSHTILATLLHSLATSNMLSPIGGPTPALVSNGCLTLGAVIWLDWMANTTTTIC